MAADGDHGLRLKRKFKSSLSTESAHKTSSLSDTKVHCKGQTVYIHTIDQAWVPAIVTSVSQKTLLAQIGTDKVVSCSVQDVLLRSEKPLDDYTNLAQVTPIHEASVLFCLQERFNLGQYYTYAGTTVVAVNPFQDVSHLYTRQQIQAYHNKLQDLPPHIYPMAEAAYTNLVRELGKVNQSILISGESGAGKTVSAKHLLKYLTVVSNPEAAAADEHAPSDVHTGGKIEQRILDSNPILEAFGNASTPRNNNSSRFGKFIQLQFRRMGHIQGGAIQTYLLEKTRVVHQGHGENNFHVFYQMTGMSPDKQYPSWLQQIQREVEGTAFSCVPHNQECRENSDIQETLDAMTDIGLGQEAQQAVYEILLAVLHLGNLRFTQVNDESSDLDCSLVSERALERSCQLLGLEATQLRQTILHRSIQPGGRARQSVFIKPIGITEAQNRRDCLSMLLYSRLFDWLVGFINHQIRSDVFDNAIGLLDIYGFEIFDVNSLEQLCINYANERLQQHYVTHFLRHLQTEYAEECIPWVPVDCGDNRPCVEILDGKSSIFGVLNEEVYLNRKSNDVALRARILDLRSESQDRLRPSRPSMASVPSFVVQHYAGSVTYTISGLVNKNKDDIPPDLISLLLASENRFVQELSQNSLCSESPGKKKKTVLTKFKSSLDELMSSLVASDTHYIRCLKPNEQNVPGNFELPYILQQLRACGTLETVDICRRGYPARMPYHEFQQRYSVILRQEDIRQAKYLAEFGDDEGHDVNVCDSLDALLHQQLDMPSTPKRTPTPRKRLRRRTGLTQHDHARKVCASVLQVVFTGQSGKTLCQQFGRTKLFLLEHQLEQLERARLEVLNENAIFIQTAWRTFYWRLRFRRHRAATCICRAWRTLRARKQYLRLHKATMVVQKAWRSFCWRQRFRRFLAATRICRAWRTFCTRRWYLSLWKATIVLQKGVRQWLHCRRLEKEKQLMEQQRQLQEEEDRRMEEERQLSLVASDSHQDELNTSSAVDEIFCACDVAATSERKDSLQSVDNSPTVVGSVSDSPMEQCSSRVPAHIDHDLSGNLSDDSGVMVHEPVQYGKTKVRPVRVHAKGTENLEPPQKRQRLLTMAAEYPGLDVQIGDGVITRRRIPKHGSRFHTKTTVLKYSHLANRRDLPSGLPDILPPPEGTPIDP